MLSPSETRDRLTGGVFISGSESNPIGLLEKALPRVIAAEPLERRLLKAQHAGELDADNWENPLEEAVSKSIITDVEANELKAVRKMVAEIIAVDEFDHSVLRMGASGEAGSLTDQAA